MPKQPCPYCHGVIFGSRQPTLERNFANHLESCPARKPVKFKDPGTEEWGSQHAVSFPAPPRKRIIPRQP